jgi:SAM-dependent methyltransferase
MDEQWWDGKYRTQGQLWSGAPNGLLVAEAADLPPGQVLDLGCGEGADALWLAAQGWLVTAVDISRVALERAVAAEKAVLAGAAAGSVATAVPGGWTDAVPATDTKVCWTHADLGVSPPPAGAFDLVSALYFPFPRVGHVFDNVLAAVAAGGTLLVGGHEFTEGHHHDADFNPDAFYRWEEIGELLDDTWTVLVNETRPRVSPAPPGSGHINDTVLTARRKR